MILNDGKFWYMINPVNLLMMVYDIFLAIIHLNVSPFIYQQSFTPLYGCSQNIDPMVSPCDFDGESGLAKKQLRPPIVNDNDKATENNDGE